MREFDTKFTPLPPVGEEFSVKVQLVKVEVLLTKLASSGTKLSCGGYKASKCHVNRACYITVFI